MTVIATPISRLGITSVSTKKNGPRPARSDTGSGARSCVATDVRRDAGLKARCIVCTVCDPAADATSSRA